MHDVGSRDEQRFCLAPKVKEKEVAVKRNLAWQVA